MEELEKLFKKEIEIKNTKEKIKMNNGNEQYTIEDAMWDAFAFYEDENKRVKLVYKKFGYGELDMIIEFANKFHVRYSSITIIPSARKIEHHEEGCLDVSFPIPMTEKGVKKATIELARQYYKIGKPQKENK